jgi:hypothetical protein
MDIAFILLFDRNYIAEGWVCHQSILDQDPSARVYVLCFDDDTFKSTRDKKCTAIKLSELETRYPQLVGARNNRHWCGYTQTCKTFIPSYVMEKYGEETLIYVDSDMLFWNIWTPVIRELENISFLVTSREHPVTVQGRFNGGFFACKNDQNSAAFFDWWQAQCIEWCLWEPGPGGRFAEEGYLNIIYDEPNKFSGVGVCSHPGVNLARWNIKKHIIEKIDDNIIVDEKYKLICFHYQSFRFFPDKLEGPNISDDLIEMIYRPYYEKLLEVM